MLNLHAVVAHSSFQYLALFFFISSLQAFMCTPSLSQDNGWWDNFHANTPSKHNNEVRSFKVTGDPNDIISAHLYNEKSRNETTTSSQRISNSNTHTHINTVNTTNFKDYPNNQATKTAITFITFTIWNSMTPNKPTKSQQPPPLKLKQSMTTINHTFFLCFCCFSLLGTPVQKNHPFSTAMIYLQFLDFYGKFVGNIYRFQNSPGSMDASWPHLGISFTGISALKATRRSKVGPFSSHERPEKRSKVSNLMFFRGRKKGGEKNWAEKNTGCLVVVFFF